MDSITQERFEQLQDLGVMIGGAVPLLLVAIYQFVFPSIQLVDSGAKIVLLCSSFAVLGLAWCMTRLMAEVRKERVWAVPLVRLGYPAQAIICVAVVHYAVLTTGGAVSSPFAYSYLYLPAVVGFVYGFGKNLIGASIALWISFLGNLFFPEWQKAQIPATLGGGINIARENIDIEAIAWIYLAIFSLQLFVSIRIAQKKQPYGNLL